VNFNAPENDVIHLLGRYRALGRQLRYSGFDTIASFLCFASILFFLYSKLCVKRNQLKGDYNDLSIYGLYIRTSVVNYSWTCRW